MINEFLKTYKDGGMVYLDPTERDCIVEEINRLKTINESHQRLNGELREEIERLHTNWKVAVEDLSRIAELLDLEEGCTIYDIEDKIKELKGEDK